MKGILNIEVYKSGIIRKSWKWRAKAPNGKIIASGRGFNSRALATESIGKLENYFNNQDFIITGK
jgi:uncharacterized protein YegP (UPF0339 family)